MQLNRRAGESSDHRHWRRTTVTAAPTQILLVGNLAAEVEDSDLLGYFEVFRVINCDTKAPGRSAYAHFGSVHDARLGKDVLQGIRINGKKITINFARPISLYVAGILPHVSGEDLRDKFGEFGKCYVSLKKGFGFVYYDNVEDAWRALLSLDGKRVCGGTVVVMWAYEQRWSDEQ